MRKLALLVPLLAAILFLGQAQNQAQDNAGQAIGFCSLSAAGERRQAWVTTAATRLVKSRVYVFTDYGHW